MILTVVANASGQGLSERRACQVLGLSPRTLQRWRQPVSAPPPPLARARSTPSPVRKRRRS